MKLKDLIKSANIDKLVDLFYWRYLEIDKKEPDKEKLRDALFEFFDSIESDKSDSPDLIVSIFQDHSACWFCSVSMANDKFVEDPPEGLTPWGGDCLKKDDCPEGYYNCNWEGYQRVYGIGGQVKNSDFYNSEIVLDDCSLDHFYGKEGLLFEIIWELTFYGWTDDERSSFFEYLKMISEDAL